MGFGRFEVPDRAKPPSRSAHSAVVAGRAVQCPVPGSRARPTVHARPQRGPSRIRCAPRMANGLRHPTRVVDLQVRTAHRSADPPAHQRDVRDRTARPNPIACLRDAPAIDQPSPPAKPITFARSRSMNATPRRVRVRSAPSSPVHRITTSPGITGISTRRGHNIERPHPSPKLHALKSGRPDTIVGSPKGMGSCHRTP